MAIDVAVRRDGGRIEDPSPRWAGGAPTMQRAHVGAVADSQPNDLWSGDGTERALREILVLRDDGPAAILGESPDRCVVGFKQTGFARRFGFVTVRFKKPGNWASTKKRITRPPIRDDRSSVRRRQGKHGYPQARGRDNPGGSPVPKRRRPTYQARP